MKQVIEVEGTAAAFLADNVDTDMIIPISQMKSMQANFADGLFFNLRFDAEGKPNPAFVLNQHAYANARILVSGANFGCGSSREHAVWALQSYGIEVVVAESFAEIFYGNCIRVGILPAVLSPIDCRQLALSVTRDEGAHRTRVDLRSKEVLGPDGCRYPFQIESAARAILLNGLEAIDIAMRKSEQIAQFETEDQKRRPWVYSFC